MPETALFTRAQQWDNHGSYRWTYFDELVKQSIDFFLSRRLNGKNLDVGGGWYLSYPDSDVVDISPVCLKNNIAPDSRKHVFDLDSIADGAHLPFANNSFDSATMISSWQYFGKPIKVLEELKRVLKPGAEVYIINGQSAGLSEMMQSEGTTSQIIERLRKHGYETGWETIPILSGKDDFQSVCIKMPPGKPRKYKESAERFLDAFVEHEARVCRDKLLQLREHPITKISRGLRRRFTAFAEEYKQMTGNTLYVFSDGISPEIDMVNMSMDMPLISCAVIPRKGNHVGAIDNTLYSLMKKHSLSASHYLGYFVGSSGIENDEVLAQALDGIMRRDHGKYSRKMAQTLINFAAAVPFCAQSEELVHKIEHAAGQDWNGAAKMLEEARAARLYSAAHQHKQHRRVDDIIAQMHKLGENPDDIAATSKFDVPVDTITGIRKAIREMGGKYSTYGWSSGDD